MKRHAGGLVELLFTFLILSLVAAFGMKTALMQMQSPKSESQVKSNVTTGNSVHFKKSEHIDQAPKSTFVHFKKANDSTDSSSGQNEASLTPQVQAPNLEVVNEVIQQVELAKELKLQEEQQVIDNLFR